MLKVILDWLAGGILGQITGPLLKAYEAKLQADGDTNKLIASERHRLLELEAESRRQATSIRLATASYWEQRVISVLLVLPFLIHVLLIGIDTNWPQPWNVEKFPEPFNEWEGVIILSYFGVQVAGSGIRALAGAIAYRK
jgi:hypothetical protein